MIVLVHELDLNANSAHLWFVDLEKCPGRLRKKIKESQEHQDVQYEDSISYSDEYKGQEDWIVKSCPVNVSKIVTWTVY